MKPATGIILVKSFCVTVAGFTAPFAAGLAQWGGEVDAGPSSVNWYIIWATSIGGAATALGGFLSTSFAKFLNNQNGGSQNGATEGGAANGAANGAAGGAKVP